MTGQVRKNPAESLIGQNICHSGSQTDGRPNITKSHKDFTVRNAIAKMKTNKGFGDDNISRYFSKLALTFIENSLAN